MASRTALVRLRRGDVGYGVFRQGSLARDKRGRGRFRSRARVVVNYQAERRS